MGPIQGPNRIYLKDQTVELRVDDLQARFLVFMHQLSSRGQDESLAMDEDQTPGNKIGGEVARYEVHYSDGTRSIQSIERRIQIQEIPIDWGASAFEAQPCFSDTVCRTSAENAMLGLPSKLAPGVSLPRTHSGRDGGSGAWLYAWPNPHPEKKISQIKFIPGEEQVVVFAVSATELSEHPLRMTERRKFVVPLQEGMSFDAIGELQGLSLDMGTIISARKRLVYPHDQWRDGLWEVNPEPSSSDALVELVAHPDAQIFWNHDGQTKLCMSLRNLEQASGIVEIEPARRPVKIRTLSKKSGAELPVRLHIHGPHGEYCPPKGYHRKIETGWFQDTAPEVQIRDNAHVYIPGSCVVDLPLGEVYIEICMGLEMIPIRKTMTVDANTEEWVIEIERDLDWRSRGWVSGDTHVHFISPTMAHLEAAGEDLNVVNLLASQWGELFTNVGDFDGKTTTGSLENGGDGEHLIRVGTENRMQTLGHISLLGYSGEMIQPLCTGGPSESALGDGLEVTMGDWARQCIKQDGLVVLPHAPNPKGERAADIVLGYIHAMEMMIFNPHTGHINPNGLADWYRYQNLGYNLPMVAGTDKMDAAMLLGGIRTYTQLDQREFNYKNWMDAVKAGNTFITVGPLLEINVEGIFPGGRIQLPKMGGRVTLSWKMESVKMDVHSLEVIVGSEIVETINLGGLRNHEGHATLDIQDSTWVALRAKAQYSSENNDVAAHTSSVQVFCADKPIYKTHDAHEILKQIEGSIAWVETLAPRSNEKQLVNLRASLETAHRRLHDRMHRNGVFHEHAAGQQGHHDH